MGRLVELGVAKGVNITDAVSVFAGAEAVDSATFEKAFGIPLADATKQIAPAAGQEGVCNGGKLACTLCDGAGKLEIACTDCAGTAKVACSSCHGRQTCPSAYCRGGWHYYPQHDRKERCRYCGDDEPIVGEAVCWRGCGYRAPETGCWRRCAGAAPGRVGSPPHA